VSNEIQRSYELDRSAPPPLPWAEYEQRASKQLNDLLCGDQRDNERAFQAFLETHTSWVPGSRSFPASSGHRPIHGALFTQPKLQGLENHVPDFMWLATDSATIYPVLIEIETPAKRWFTQKGDPTSDLTHAMQQLFDWRRWFAAGANHSWFRDFYRISSDLWLRRELQPLYVLVYGSRSEFVENPEFNKKRSHVPGAKEKDFYVLTFDRLAPDHLVRQAFCARAASDGFYTISVPSTLTLGPAIAETLCGFRDKEAAVDSNPWMTAERKEFLKRRFSYWQEWTQQNRGPYVVSDRE
jgi:hypothetical protein